MFFGFTEKKWLSTLKLTQSCTVGDKMSTGLENPGQFRKYISNPLLDGINQSCTVLCYELYRIEMPFSLLETLNYSKLKLSLKIKIKLYKTYPGRSGSIRITSG